MEHFFNLGAYLVYISMIEFVARILIFFCKDSFIFFYKMDKHLYKARFRCNIIKQFGIL